MNKTQKSAIVGLVITLLSLTSVVAGVITVPTSSAILARKFLFFITLVILVFSIVFIRRKQSSSEPAFDERDVLIKQKATTCSFISLWLILIAICTATTTVLGAESSVSVLIFPLILLLIFAAVSIVYFAAILIQYGWKEKNYE